MGIIINQPMDLTLGEVFEQLDLKGPSDIHPNKVLQGGPVNPEQGMVLHREKGNWSSTVSITDDFHLTSSSDIISALAQGTAPPEAQLVLGYAGWSKGQLEEELANNFWLTTPANTDIIFDETVENRWGAIAKTLGIDLNLVTPTAGHS